jgi:hypothetical protein
MNEVNKIKKTRYNPLNSRKVNDKVLIVLSKIEYNMKNTAYASAGTKLKWLTKNIAKIFKNKHVLNAKYMYL